MKIVLKNKELWERNKTGLALRLLSHFGMHLVVVLLVIQCIAIIKADFPISVTVSLIQLFTMCMILSVLVNISTLMFLNYILPLEPCNDR